MYGYTDTETHTQRSWNASKTVWKGKKRRHKTDETCEEIKDALETYGKDPKDLQKIWEVERLLSEILYISSEDYGNYLLSQNTEEAIHFIGN